jgi:pimeloyl-ACP methyl ester carboxylesterase
MAKKQTFTIVLVHGAWSDSSAWSEVIPMLKVKGHEVINVNLPGHAADNTPFAEITLRSYVDAVKAAIGDRKDIILVGHSMAGIVITQVGEEIPGQIKKLIYPAAFLPLDGQSLLDLGKTDTDGHTGWFLQIDQPNHIAIIKREGIIDVFLENAPKEIIDKVLANWKDEPLAPLVTPVHVTAANFGSVKKIFIHTEYDHSVGYTLQLNMVKATPVAKEYTLASSHTPFFSMPSKLADILLEESNR